jgi:hypothetical protein
MVAAGGLGLLVVVAFVAAVAFGSRPVPPRGGERIALGAGSDGLEVAVARCPEERVAAVQLGPPGGLPAWRVEAPKGSIQDRFVVGGEAPTDFATVVPLYGPVEGAVEVAVELAGGGGDRARFDAAALPDRGFRHLGATVSAEQHRQRALGALHCDAGAGDRAALSWLFAGGAAVVAVAYLGMVARWWRGRP